MLAELRKTLWFLSFAIAILSGCAGGEIAEPSQEDPQDQSIDELDISPNDSSSDQGELDTHSVELADDDSDDGQESELFCTPGDASCTSSSIRSVCNSQGSAFEDEPCDEHFTCLAGICEPQPQLCQANARDCVDVLTLEICAADGYSTNQQSCAPGRCLAGACTSGSPTAATCALDNSCAGGNCYCSDSCMGTAFAGGFCTTLDCQHQGCLPGEHCLELNGNSLCVPGCGDCARSGMICASRPLWEEGSLRWGEACVPDDGRLPLGAYCTQDSDCAGGLCLLNSPNGDVIANGYCSSPCSTHSECPAEGSCIRATGYLDDTGFCVLSCVDDQCPDSRPESLKVTCIATAAAQGGLVTSCFQP